MVDICYPEGTDWTCYGDEATVDALDETMKERSEALAWSTLSALTGYRLSLCPVVIRPCARRCGIGTYYVAPVWDTWGGRGNGAFAPYISGGSWFNACGCVDDCSCTSIPQIILPSEVGGINSIWMDGEELPATAYRVDNGNKLVRTDGEAWPFCQDMTNSDREVGGLFVEYYAGVAPNDLFRYAAGVLAAEYYKACSGRECRLPTGVTNITRQGMVMEVTAGSFPSGWTGIYEVDAVIRVYNPYGLKQRARALSVDVARGRTQTWGA